MTTAPPALRPALSCYTSALVHYLGRVAPETQPQRALARAIGLRVRSDLPGALEFVHHRRIDSLDGLELAYRSAADWDATSQALAAELCARGAVVAVANGRHLAWSPNHGRVDVPHWIVVEDRRPGGWQVADPFTARLPIGEQRPWSGLVGDADLRAMLTPMPGLGVEQVARESHALGGHAALPDLAHYRWLAQAAPAAEPAAGTWVDDSVEALELLAGRLSGDAELLHRHCDDVWAAARHRSHHVAWMLRERSISATSAGELAGAWEALPRALRFAALSHARGRSRPATVERAFEAVAHAERTIATPAVGAPPRVARTAAPAPDSVVGERFDAFLLDAGRPDAPAVVEFAAGDLVVTTYRELAAATTRYAAELRQLGVGVGMRAVVQSDGTAAGIALTLACSRAGATFVPIGAEVPGERVADIVAVADPVAYLQPASERERRYEHHLPGDLTVLEYDAGGLRMVRPGRGMPSTGRLAATPTDPAYIVFTSGSTGRPKGVVMSHRAVVAFYRGMHARRFVGPGDRIASTSPAQFDFSLLDLGLALGSGGALVPVPRNLLRWPRRFVEVLRATGATFVNGVPSIWRAALQHEPDRLARLEQVRGVLFCGESFPLSELRALNRALPNARLVNCYGATESMACSFAELARPVVSDAGRISIGTPHEGAEVLLVRADGSIIDGLDEVGEMYLRSPALFTGYWDDPEATERALVADPVEPRSSARVLRTGDLAYRDATAQLYFVGRVDAQVQIRGNRVELEEVERRLAAYPGASRVCAALDERGSEPRLVAFVVAEPAGETTLDVPALMAFGRRHLPDYMIPSHVHVVDDVPLTANGKVDRERLVAGAYAVAARPTTKEGSA
jgi:amino acid adenylation domain-containing protein